MEAVVLTPQATAVVPLAEASELFLAAARAAMRDVSSVVALRSLVAQLQQHLDRVTLLHANTLQKAQEHGAHIGTGARSMADWLSKTAGTSYGDTVAKTKLASVLAQSAELAAAVDSGEVSPATAGVLFDAISKPPSGADIGELVDLVKGADPKAARAKVELWRHWNGPETDEDRAERCHQARSLVFDIPVDGMISGSFRLPVLEARQVQAAVSAIAGKPHEHDQRTTAQRMADGLVLLCDAYAKGEVTGGRERGTLLVTVPVSTLEGTSDEPGATTWGDVVPAASARRMAGDSNLVGVLLNGSQPLALGRTKRWASNAQWMALVARDGGCRWAGCQIPAEWCDLDHIVPWEAGGRTDLINLWLLCRVHHTEKHRRGVLVEGNGLDATVVLADGTRVHSPPRPLAARICAA